MKKINSIFLLIIFYSTFSFTQTNITFINPGKSDEHFWLDVSNFMRAAAEDLSINLEIFYSERNPENTEIIVNSIIKRQIKPDYLVIVNEDLSAPEVIELADENSIKTFLTFNDLNSKQKSEAFGPRKLYKNWMGTLIPDNHEAGYMLAERLIGSKTTPLNMVAIAGNHFTSASLERVNGLNTSLEENKNVKLIETVYSDWDEKKAYEVTKDLINKNEKIDLIWAINDPSAIGALRAIKELGLKPGKDIFVGGINWADFALEKIKSEELVCSVGGHFMLGAWTLVILKDMAEGIDFVDETKITELEVSLFETIDKSNVDIYLSYFDKKKWHNIDFKKFSKFYNKDLENYNFNYETLVENFDN